MKMTPDADRPRILVYRLGSLGDTCIALPALRVVRRAFPDALITLLTNLPVSAKAALAPALLEGLGLADDFLAYPVGTRSVLTLVRLAWELRSRRFSAVVNLAAWRGGRRLARDAKFFRGCGIPRLVGFAAGPEHDLRRAVSGEAEREAARLLRRVAALGAADPEDPSNHGLQLTPSERGEARRLLASAGIAGSAVVFSVGTKVPANDWGQENWRELLRLAGLAGGGTGAVFIGSADETARADECLSCWPGPRANFCGRLAPRASAAVLAAAQVFVGHDSGPLHLAAAAGTPCIGIFSARNLPGQWFPLGRGHRIFFEPVQCMGCGLDTCTDQGMRCLRAIRPEIVAHEIASRLAAVPHAVA